MKIGYRKPSFSKRIAARTSIKRAVRSKLRVPKGFGFFTNPKKAIYNATYSRTTRKACYIATAVYGDTNAWQVEKLRQYRDNCLSKYLLGRAFISVYYTVSPNLVNMFEKVSRKLLDILVERI